MTTQALIDAVDQEITRLELVRKLLAEQNGLRRSGVAAAAKPKRRASRPALRGDGQENVAGAQRKRWAVPRKAAKRAARG